MGLLHILIMSKGIANVTLKYSKPVTFGVLTVDTIEQALRELEQRVGIKGLKG